jgi:hypothetical protein
MTMKRAGLIIAALMAIAIATTAAVGPWSITRGINGGGSSSMGLDSVGGVYLTPKSGQGVVIGGGAAIKKVLTGTASVDFTALAAGACENLTITVTGAADGDPVYVGIPAAAWATTEYATINYFVSSANTVTVKRCNLTNATTALSNPAPVTIRAVVIQF